MGRPKSARVSSTAPSLLQVATAPASPRGPVGRRSASGLGAAVRRPPCRWLGSTRCSPATHRPNRPASSATRERSERLPLPPPLPSLSASDRTSDSRPQGAGRERSATPSPLKPCRQTQRETGAFQPDSPPGRPVAPGAGREIFRPHSAERGSPALTLPPVASPYRSGPHDVQLGNLSPPEPLPARAPCRWPAGGGPTRLTTGPLRPNARPANPILVDSVSGAPGGTGILACCPWTSSSRHLGLASKRRAERERALMACFGHVSCGPRRPLPGIAKAKSRRGRAGDLGRLAGLLCGGLGGVRH